MKSIGFAFDNFNFVVDPLKLSGMDGVIAVVDDPVPMAVNQVQFVIHYLASLTPLCPY